MGWAGLHVAGLGEGRAIPSDGRKRAAADEQGTTCFRLARCSLIAIYSRRLVVSEAASEASTFPPSKADA